MNANCTKQRSDICQLIGGFSGFFFLSSVKHNIGQVSQQLYSNKVLKSPNWSNCLLHICQRDTEMSWLKASAQILTRIVHFFHKLKKKDKITQRPLAAGRVTTQILSKCLRRPVFFDLQTTVAPPLTLPNQSLLADVKCVATSATARENCHGLSSNFLARKQKSALPKVSRYPILIQNKTMHKKMDAWLTEMEVRGKLYH